MLPNPDFTVGNTITVGIAIYKQNWRQYLKLSAIAHLWLLVPVYGWARYFAIAGHISKLSLNSLSQKLTKTGKYFINNTLITYLNTGIISIAYCFFLVCLSNAIIVLLSIYIDFVVALLSVFFTHFLIGVISFLVAR